MLHATAITTKLGVFKIVGVCQPVLYAATLIGIDTMLQYNICTFYVLRCTLDMLLRMLVVSPDTSELVNVQYVVYMLGRHSKLDTFQRIENLQMIS